MTTVVQPGPYVTQNSPSRFFGMVIVQDRETFYSFRDAAYGQLVQAIQNRGKLPASYDIRPVSPVDDFGTLKGSVTNNYFGDWTIASASITDTGGSLAGAGNTILTGTMPENRWLILYGTELLTARPAPEVMWKFSGGANAKTVWFVQDLFGWAAVENPKAATQVMPKWNPSEPVQHVVYATGSRIIYDVHWTLWAEPTATTITSITLRA